MLKTLILISTFILSSQAFSEIYIYTDDDGSQFYVTDEKLVPEKYKDRARKADSLPKINKVPSQSYSPSTTKRYQNSPKKVEVFVTSWCPYCKKLENALQSKGITYTRYDIEKSSKGKKLYQQMGLSGGVPVTKIGSEIIMGANISAIQNALK